MSILGYITDLGNMIESIALFFFAFDFVTRNPLQVAGVDKTDIDSPPGTDLLGNSGDLCENFGMKEKGEYEVFWLERFGES
ncbi:hypothetical protein I7I51_00752 [Histoplasma capsulatum]|uniref:Uncharacterized protein n=1 Tax=Ajellomyces capsulatus TaxID=5037 RepID=A0A8A1MGA3_AJECA|nr:hypothetical protein I7I51_00752 [Histoplasma capsulatum]